MARIPDTSSSRPSLAWLCPAQLRTRLQTAWRPRRIYLHVPRQVGGQANHEAATRAFAQWCEGNAGAVCEMGLPSHMLLTSLAPVGADRVAAQRQALADWAHYHDIGSNELAQQWDVRQVCREEIALVCAMPRALLDGLLAQAQVHGVRIVWVGPWWGRGLQRWLRYGMQDKHTDNAQASSDTHQRLQLLEPGYMTWVEAKKEGRGLVVDKMWLEAGECQVGDDDVLAVRAADAATVDHAQAMVWDHAAIADVFVARRAWRSGEAS